MKKAVILISLVLFSKSFSQFNTVSYSNKLNTIKVSEFTENRFNGNFMSYHIEGKSNKKSLQEKKEQEKAKENTVIAAPIEKPKEPKPKISASKETEVQEIKTETSDLEEDIPVEEPHEIPDKKIHYKKLNLITQNNYEFSEKQFVFMPLRKMVITSGYGSRFHPIDKVSKFHAGADLRANSDYVYAVLDGIVSDAGYNKGSGNYIKIQHKGFEIIYMHLSRIFYSEGDIIYAGDIVALSGNTGKSTAPHLHFAVKENGKYINPIQFLNDLIQTNNALADYNYGK